MFSVISHLIGVGVVLIVANGCVIDNIPSPNATYWSGVPVDDSYVGTVIVLKTANVTAAYVDSDEPVYADVKLENDELIIFTTEKFANDYELEQSSDLLEMNIKTVCEGTSYVNTLTYSFLVVDVNNHEPVFDKKNYEYVFYDEIPASPDLNLAPFDEIRVVDYDISNTGVNFRIEENVFFTITYSRYVSHDKAYFASLRAIQDVKAPFHATYRISASDSGEKEILESFANVTIIVLKSFYPIFTNSLYFGYVENLKVVAENGAITLDNVDNLININFSLSGEYNEIFLVEVTDKITILVKDVDELTKLISSGRTAIILTLTASTADSDNDVETSVLIKLSPDKSSPESSVGACNVPDIESLDGIYECKYHINDTHVGVIEKLDAQDFEDAHIKNSDYLEAYLEDGKLVFATTKEFEHYEENEVSSLIAATLLTKCDDGEHELTYVVHIDDSNNHVPQFEDEYYYYIFYNKVPDSFDLNEFSRVYAIDRDVSNERVVFDIEENDYLQLDFDDAKFKKNGRRYPGRLTLKKGIEAPFNETFTITVTDSGEPPLSSSVSLTLLVRREAVPVFTRSLYKAHVTEDQKVIVEDGPIALEGADNMEDLKFDVCAEYDAFFDLNVTDIISILINDNRDPSRLISEENDTIVITIYFEGDSPQFNGETSVLVNMSALLVNTEGTTKIPDEEVTDETTAFTAGETDFTTEDDKYTEPGTDFIGQDTDFTTEDDKETVPATVSSSTVVPESTPGLVTVDIDGFNFWVTMSKTFNILIAVIAGIMALGGIIFLRRKLTSGRK